MKVITSIVLLLLISSNFILNAQTSKEKITLVIHGGAGTILKKNMTAEQEKAYHAKLEEALEAGYQILHNGGTCGNAVIAAIKVMEDSPLFNAGKGAVFTNKGNNELDASFMDGKTLKAGAIASVTNIKNPIEAARAVLLHSPHVMLVGKGAEDFAASQDIELVPNSYFHTERREKQLEKAKQIEDSSGHYQGNDEGNHNFKFGTVGAVALDAYGNLAAGTSTGGMTNKRFGRVGDSPIIGAGTYANNQTCAVSATGHGEYFIRLQVAHDVAAQMEYKKNSLKKAAKNVIHTKLTQLGGTGGIIALDKNGNIAMPFNTEGMYRGYVKADGEKVVMIYKEKK